MRESLLFHNINMIWKYSIANTSCRLCIIVNIMQVQLFNTNRYVSFFIPILSLHKLDISEFWLLSTYPLLFTFIIFSSNTIQYFHICKNVSNAINNSQKFTSLYRGYEPFRGHASRTLRHMWTRDHTCNIQIPTVCSLWHRHSETKHDVHIATDFVSRPCGSNRILLAGFSIL